MKCPYNWNVLHVCKHTYIRGYVVSSASPGTVLTHWLPGSSSLWCLSWLGSDVRSDPGQVAESRPAVHLLPLWLHTGFTHLQSSCLITGGLRPEMAAEPQKKNTLCGDGGRCHRFLRRSHLRVLSAALGNPRWLSAASSSPRSGASRCPEPAVVLPRCRFTRCLPAARAAVRQRTLMPPRALL